MKWPIPRGVARARKRVVNDWLTAITQDREPICSGYARMKALEMAMAVFAAGWHGAGFPFLCSTGSTPWLLASSLFVGYVVN